jgi:hypothetical protein
MARPEPNVPNPITDTWRREDSRRPATVASNGDRSRGDVEVAVEDVFGGLAGGPGDGAGGGDVHLPTLEHVLDGAALWGIELDPKFRVLAATLEPTAERYPWGDPDDRRVQLLCFPVSTILGSFRRNLPMETELLSFTEAQLVDVVAAFDGARVSAPLFGRPEPRPGSWGPRFSLEGRSSAPDGVSKTLTVALAHEDLTLHLFARFDEVQLKAADGRELALPAG